MDLFKHMFLYLKITKNGQETEIFLNVLIVLIKPLL